MVNGLLYVQLRGFHTGQNWKLGTQFPIPWFCEKHAIEFPIPPILKRLKYSRRQFQTCWKWRNWEFNSVPFTELRNWELSSQFRPVWNHSNNPPLLPNVYHSFFVKIYGTEGLASNQYGGGFWVARNKPCHKRLSMKFEPVAVPMLTKLTSYHCAIFEGLKMVLNTESEKHLRTLTEAQGVRVLVHRSTEMPFPDQSGLTLPSGMEGMVGITVVRLCLYPRSLIFFVHFKFNFFC